MRALVPSGMASDEKTAKGRPKESVRPVKG